MVINDNGSRVVAMLEVARQLSEKKKKKGTKGENTILVVAIDLEEYSLRYIIIFIMAVRTAGVNLLNS